MKNEMMLLKWVSRTQPDGYNKKYVALTNEVCVNEMLGTGLTTGGRGGHYHFNLAPQLFAH